MTYRFYPWLVGVLLLILGFLNTSVSAASPKPIVVLLPSAIHSGSKANDTIWVTYYPAATTRLQLVPAVVLVHSLADSPGSDAFHFLTTIAHAFSAHGIACALMTLPYHMRRLSPGDLPLHHYAGPDVDADVAAFAQSASDVETVVTWLSQRPEIDSTRVGALGLSLGAIVVHLAMGQDERIRAGVALLGGGDLAGLYRRSVVIKMFGQFSPNLLNAHALERLETVDPLRDTTKNRPRHVLMVAAARDLYIPPANATALWEALGHPPIFWVDTNHFMLLFASGAVARMSEAYLTRVWAGLPDDPTALPRLKLPTVQAGLLVGLDSVVTANVQWQALSFASRPDHLSAVHLDLDWSGRGPFVGLAATVNPFLDIGLGHRLLGNGIKPYAALHLTF